jgi:hypothetical protein
MNRDEIRTRLIAAALSGLASTEGWGSEPAPAIAKLAVKVADETLQLLDAELAPVAEEPPKCVRGPGDYRITYHYLTDWTVFWGDQVVDHLNWDEMIGQIIVLTAPEDKVRVRRLYNSTPVNQTAETV